MDEVTRLLELHQRAIEQVGRYPRRRFLYERLKNSPGRHLVGVVGPRGCGKTVLLRQLAADTPDSLYVSLDTLSVKGDIFELAGNLERALGVRTLFLDEVGELIVGVVHADRRGHRLGERRAEPPGPPCASSRRLRTGGRGPPAPLAGGTHPGRARSPALPLDGDILFVL